MAVIVGDILEVTFQGTIFNQRVLTVLHYRTDIAPTVHTDSLDAQDMFLTAIKQGGVQDKTQKYLDCVSNLYSLDNIVAQFVYPVRYRRSSVPQALAGSRVGTPGTANVSAVIEKLSRLAGKANRGSVHLPAIVNGDYNNGVISNTLNNLMVILGFAWTVNVTELGGGAGVWAPIIFHRRAPGSLAQIWSQYAVMQTTRTMRRRTVGVGK